MRTIYLSGPITGMPEKNHPLFMRVAGILRSMGHRVYNPREFTWTDAVFPKRRAFAEYCDFICNEADTIVLLPGWERSKGATTERGLAENCSLEIIEWVEWESALFREPDEGCDPPGPTLQYALSAPPAGAAALNEGEA